MTPSPCGRYLVCVFPVRIAMERLERNWATTEWQEHVHFGLVLGLS